MPGKNLDQVYMDNPITSNTGTDLMYFMQSPYASGTDAAMMYANFAAQFGAAYTPAALTEVDDTNVTLTLGGSPSTALLHATSITAGWTGTLSGARGGTGVANTGLTIDLSGASTGYVLTSDFSGNATWQASGGGGSVTANNIQQQSFIFAIDNGAGPANTFNITLSPAPTLQRGSVVVFQAQNTNSTGVALLNVNGNGAVNIVDGQGTYAPINSILAYGIYMVVENFIDLGGWQMIGPMSNYA